jgi:hypothetical protein
MNGSTEPPHAFLLYMPEHRCVLSSFWSCIDVSRGIKCTCHHCVCLASSQPPHSRMRRGRKAPETAALCCWFGASLSIVPVELRLRVLSLTAMIIGSISISTASSWGEIYGMCTALFDSFARTRDASPLRERP